MERVQHVRKLFKTILRLHRSLPEDLRALGNEYAREEFKRHKKCTEPEAVMFLNEWTNYAISLHDQFSTKNLREGGIKIGQDLNPELLEQMRDEQIAQLYELMKATKAEKES